MRFVGGPMHGQQMAVPEDARRWRVAEADERYSLVTELDPECQPDVRINTHTYEKVILMSPTENRGIWEKVMLHERLISGFRDPESRAVARWMELRQPPVVLDGLR